MSLSDVTADVHQRLQPARERVAEQVDVGRSRVSEAVSQAREAAEPVRDQAREAAARAADAAGPKVEQVRRSARPAATRVKDAAVEGGHVVAAVVPSILERLVAVLTALFGDLEQKGRELAHQVEPPRTATRKNRWKLAGWFAGGFAVGAGAGWYAHQRYADQGIEGATDPETHARDLSQDPAPYGEEAAAIDARREDVSLN